MHSRREDAKLILVSSFFALVPLRIPQRVGFARHNSWVRCYTAKQLLGSLVVVGVATCNPYPHGTMPPHFPFLRAG
jgi:hypothetical protein